jgi:hypothetical protein
MFDDLRSIPWHRLQHAYGPATDARRWIPALVSDDPDLRDEAVYGFLHSSICHQYTVYSATPYVIPFVIEILRDGTCCDLPVAAGTLRHALLDFLSACTHAGKTNRPVATALLAGRDVYAVCVSDPVAKIARDARALLEFCASEMCQ